MKNTSIHILFLLTGALAVLAPAGSTFAEDRVVDVVLSSDSNLYAEGVAGIQSALQAKTKLHYLDAAAPGEEEIAVFFRTMEESPSASVIVAVGQRAAREALRHVKKKTVVFSLVNAPKSLDFTGRPLCGVSMDIPMEMFFRTLKELKPKARRVIAFYTTEEGAFAAGEGEYSDLKHNLFYTKRKVNRGEFAAVLQEYKGRVDGIQIIADPLYDQENFDAVSRFARENGIVLMTTFPSLVRVGATFGISPDSGSIGALTGRMAERILTGKSDCAGEGIILPDQVSLYLNESYAAGSGISIPDFLKERARRTRLFKAGVHLLAEGKLAESKEIFQAVLSRDPDNQLAQFYVDLVVEKLTGKETAQLLQEAEKHFQAHNYPLARARYEQVLRLNPSLRSARDGLAKSVHEQSEQERGSGNVLETSGKPFEAIKMYTAALQTLPTNARAQAELAALRARLFARIPEILKSGIAEYNERNYRGSIASFESILLVDPANKQAVEYLRLSRKKLEALDRRREHTGRG